MLNDLTLSNSTDRPLLITGANGFIGRHLMARLSHSGRPVMAVDRSHGDISDVETLAPFEQLAPSCVIHLAARTFVPDAWQNPGAFFQTNLTGTVRTLEFCRRTGANLIYLSAYVYGTPDRLPIDEAARINCTNPYAHSKHLAEQLCNFYAENFAIGVTILRPFNVYGPAQDRRFLIPTILDQIRTRQKIEMQDLTPRRDVVFVTDVVDAILLAERRGGHSCQIFNVGGGLSYSVAELVAVSQTVAGTRLTVESRSVKRVNEIPDTVADVTKAKVELGWSPQYGLYEGLRECWEYEMKRQ